MNSFYSETELTNLGFKQVGYNVLISRNASIYGASNIVIGNNVRIDDFCILSGRIELGNNIHIAAYTALYGGTAGIFVDDFASISSRVSVYSVSDDYTGEAMTNPMVPEEFRSVKSAPVHVGRHVIIGATSVVLPGVNLLEGSSFGAFSFINHDAEMWSMNVGIPCHKISDRAKGVLEMEEKFLSGTYK